jgi:hypothetical protein
MIGDLAETMEGPCSHSESDGSQNALDDIPLAFAFFIFQNFRNFLNVPLRAHV